MVPLNGKEEVPIQAQVVLVVAKETTLLFLEALGMVLRAWVVFDAWAWEFLAFLELPEAHWTFQDPMDMAVEETALLFLEALWAGLDIDQGAWVVWRAWAFLELPLETLCFEQPVIFHLRNYA